jgi:hypothetical protein
MQAGLKIESGDTVDDIINAIRTGESKSTLVKEVRDLETVIRAIGQLLTPEQCVALKTMTSVKSLLDQDNIDPIRNRCCGTLGGFGTEELEEWERARAWLVP